MQGVLGWGRRLALVAKLNSAIMGLAGSQRTETKELVDILLKAKRDEIKAPREQMPKHINEDSISRIDRTSIPRAAHSMRWACSLCHRTAGNKPQLLAQPCQEMDQSSLGYGNRSRLLGRLKLKYPLEAERLRKIMHYPEDSFNEMPATKVRKVTKQ